MVIKLKILNIRLLALGTRGGYSVYISFYEMNGVPEALPISAAYLFFLFAITPIFSGEEIFGKQFPKLSLKGKVVALVFGPICFLVIILGFAPRWVDQEILSERLPFCHVERTWVDDNQYRVAWITDSDHSFWTHIGPEESKREVGQSGSYTFDWNNGNVFLIHTISARNRFGTCSDSVIVWHPNGEWDEPLTCRIWSDQTTVEVGESFLVSWRIDGPKFVAARVNGALVDRQDSAKYSLSPERRYVKFSLTVNGRDVYCEDDVVISTKL